MRIRSWPGRVGRRTPYVRRLIHERDSLKREVRSLKAQVAPRTHVQYQYVFIVTYGRSGSTLLQGILDSQPGFLIRGENGGALYRLFKFHQTIVHRKTEMARASRRQGFSGPLPSTHAWFGLDGYPVNTAVRDIRSLVLDTILRPEQDTRVVGFKEIRWAQDDLADYLVWITEVFPGARFIVNTRSNAAVSQSHWWTKDPNASSKIKKREDAILAATDPLKDRAYRVHFDDYVADPSVLRGLFEWLGEEFNEERVRHVLDQQHSLSIGGLVRPH